MFQFKRILKSILKYKTSSVLTLLSLIISFTGIIILTLYVSFEKSFDRFHENAESAYRLETKDDGSWLPATMSEVIKKSIPEVESVTPIWSDEKFITTPKLNETNTKFSSDIYFADSSFFDIFTFPLILGNKATALNEPHAAVISESLSHKLFAGANPVGQTILINNILYRVKAVMADFPENSSLQADCILAFSVYKEEKEYTFFNSWDDWSFSNVMKLAPGSDPQLVAEKIESLPEISEQIKEEKEQYSKAGTFMFLRRIDKIHFFNDESLESYTNPVVLDVLILLIVILSVMGAVNFINFSTSQAPLRAKALSVMRVMGGTKRSSMAQIIAESVLLSLVALLISLLIYRMSYVSIESLFDIKGLSFDGRSIFILLFVLFALAFGVLVGLYPAKYITSPPIAQTVKGNIHFLGKGKTFRNTLIIIQFVFTIALISASFIIEKQLNYWRNFDIGINKEQVVYLHTSSELQKHYQAFADELLNDKNIVDYTYAQFIPGNVGMGWGREVDEQYVSFTCWPVDDHFLNFFGIDIADGRKFTKGSKADINSFILNKKAVEKFGWQNPLERKIKGFENIGQVIGVSKNFNFSSLKGEVSPMAFWLTENRKDNLMLRIAPGNYTQIMEFIKSTAHKFDLKNQFEVKFLDDTLNRLYAKEERMARFIEFVSLWTILLAVTGLLGLIIFISRDRIKEIGIRKVNGARISEVMTMLNKDFIKWVAISFVIATPIAYYAMNKWLENFAYKTTLSWWIFALAGLLALTIAMITVSWQSWRAATRNPVEALRYE